MINDGISDVLFVSNLYYNDQSADANREDSIAKNRDSTYNANTGLQQRKAEVNYSKQLNEETL